MQRNRVLIVDDSRVVRITLTRMLGDRYRLVEAVDGQAAWARLLEAPDIGLVFTDRSMPIVDGVELLRRIRAGEGADAGLPSDLPVILVTGQEQDATADAVPLEPGANAVLCKPFDRSRIRELAAELLAPREDAGAASPASTVETPAPTADPGDDSGDDPGPSAATPPAAAPAKGHAGVESVPAGRGAAPDGGVTATADETRDTVAQASAPPVPPEPPASIAALQAEIDALQSELLLRQLTQSERRVQREILGLRQTVDACEQQRGELQARVAQAETALARLRDADHDRAKAVAECVRIEQEVVDLTETRRRLLEQIAEQRRSESTLREERDAARQAEARAAAQLRETRSECEAERARLQALTERFATREQRVQELEHRLIELQERLHEQQERATASAEAAPGAASGSGPRTWSDARHAIASPRRHWVRLALLASAVANLLLIAAFLILWFAGRTG